MHTTCPKITELSRSYFMPYSISKLRRGLFGLAFSIFPKIIQTVLYFCFHRYNHSVNFNTVEKNIRISSYILGRTLCTLCVLTPLQLGHRSCPPPPFNTIAYCPHHHSGSTLIIVFKRVP